MTKSQKDTAEAEQALKQWRIPYTIEPDGSLLVRGDIDIRNKGLTRLPDLSCVAVLGDVYCSYNELTSLAGAPATVGGGFYCYRNQLTSLEGAPATVGRGFYCYDNQLTSLEGAPATVGRDFVCDHNQLASLAGAPVTVGRDFECYCNQLTSLAGAPATVGRNFTCADNQLPSLEGAPQQFATLKSDFGAFASLDSVIAFNEERRRIARAEAAEQVFALRMEQLDQFQEVQKSVKVTLRSSGPPTRR